MSGFPVIDISDNSTEDSRVSDDDFPIPSDHNRRRVVKSQPQKSDLRVDVEHPSNRSLIVKITGLNPSKLLAATSGKLYASEQAQSTYDKQLRPQLRKSSLEIANIRAELQAVSNHHKAASVAASKYSDLRVASAHDREAVAIDVKQLEDGVDLAAWHGLGPGYAATLDETLADEGKLGALLAGMYAEHRRETSQGAALLALKRKHEDREANSRATLAELRHQADTAAPFDEDAAQAALILVSMKKRNADVSSEILGDIVKKKSRW